MRQGDGAHRRYWLAGKREPVQDEYFREALSPAIWQAGDETDWDTCWYTGMPAAGVFSQLAPGKSVNHIPGNNSLTVKSNLHATLAATRDRLAVQEGPRSERCRRLAFFPTTYSMPHGYHALQEAACADTARRWILKPKNSARGRDIALVGDAATVPTGERWMVQSYLDRPHTMFGRKYVLRLYVLVTSVEPLRAYLYHEGSAKLASARYDPEDTENVYAHLTNPDINAGNRDSASPVVFVNLARYREWLREQGHDDEPLFARLRDLLALTLISAREKMRRRLRAVDADTTGCYELLGMDCLVDADLNPWILECNLSPSLETCAAPEDGGDVEARNKRQMIEDMVALLRLNEPAGAPPQDDDPGARLRREAQAEADRAGGWQRLLPAGPAADCLPFFPFPRLADMVLADWVAGGSVPRPRVRARETAEIIADNRLSLYSERNQTLYTPNDSAAWIWLKATDGVDPDSIAAELAAARGGDATTAWETRREVWDVLADWAEAGLLMQDSGAAPAAPAAGEDAVPPRAAVTAPLRLAIAGTVFELAGAGPSVRHRLEAALAPLITSAPDEPAHRLSVLESGHGFAVADERRVLADGLSLARLTPAIVTVLHARAGDSGSVRLNGALVPLAGGRGAVFVLPGPGDWDDHAAGLQLAAGSGAGLAGGGLFDPGGDGRVTALGLPARAALGRTGDPAGTGMRHVWGDGTEGHLVASTPGLSGQRHDVGTVVLPRPDGDPQPRAATVAEVLAVIIETLPAPPRGTAGLSASAVTALADWLESRRLVAVDGTLPASEGTIPPWVASVLDPAGGAGAAS